MSLNIATAVRQPPFSSAQSLFSPPSDLLSSSDSTFQPAQPQSSSKLPNLVLPAVYQDAQRSLQKLDQSEPAALHTYLAYNLNVDALMEIHKHLWIAGLPKGPKALHAQILVDRRISITERADLHLLWQGKKVFLKPLPDYLTCHAVWERCLCKDQAMYADAAGFLASYLWLIQNPSDLKIAHEHGLVSQQINWTAWSAFSQKVASELNLHTFENINPRYMYGELRLNRVNNICRFCSRTTTFTRFLRGYQHPYHDYSTFVERNFAWFLTVVVYVGLVLTAMQVGLGTEQLQNNAAFKRASYGFTIFAILAPLIVICLGGLTVLFLVLFNAKYALARRQQASSAYAALLASERLQIYKH